MMQLGYSKYSSSKGGFWFHQHAGKGARMPDAWSKRTWLLAPPQSPHSSLALPLLTGRPPRGGLLGEGTLDGGGGV
jgi:hypothetical protein